MRGSDDLDFAANVVGERGLHVAPQRVGKRDLDELARSARFDQSAGRVEILLGGGLDRAESVSRVCRRSGTGPGQQHDGSEALGERVVDLPGHPGAFLEDAA